MSTIHVDIVKPLIKGIYDVLYGSLSCPVYKSIPKTPASLYVHIHNVLHTEDGTKDDFVYYGTVQIEVVDESKHRADTAQALAVLADLRAALKPSKAAVFTVSPRTLIVFSHASYNELIEPADNGISRSRLIDIYNFEIE